MYMGVSDRLSGVGRNSAEADSAAGLHQLHSVRDRVSDPGFMHGSPGTGVTLAPIRESRILRPECAGIDRMDQLGGWIC